MECDKAELKANFSSLRSGKNHRGILRGAAAAVDLGLDEKQTSESRSKEALNPKLLVVFVSPLQLTDDNCFLLTSLSFAVTILIHVQKVQYCIFGDFWASKHLKAYVCSSRLAEGNQLQECVLEMPALLPVLPCLLQLLLLPPLPRVPSLQKGN